MIAAVLLVLASVLFFFVGSVYAKKRKFRCLDSLPGPPHLPVIGSVLEFGLKPAGVYKGLMRLSSQYGHVQKFWLGPLDCVVLTDEPDLIEHIVSTPKYNMKAILYKYLKPWLSNGLLLSDGDYWHKRRKAITPTFHFKILDSFVRVFQAQADALVERLSEKIDKGQFDVYPYIADYTLDTICETAMGTQLNIQKQPNNEYAKRVRCLSDILIKKAFSPWKSFKFLYMFSSDAPKEKECLEVLHKFTMNIINKRRAELEAKPELNAPRPEDDLGVKRRAAFLDMLLSCTIDGQPLTNEDIREEVDTFMFEGHDTTASALSFALYLLANHPEVQNKLVEELHDLFGDEQNRELSLTDLNNMKYSEAVLKETLRLYPSVALIGRELKEEVHYKNFFIPKGVQVLVNITSMQRRPDIFPDPDKFIPERFLELKEKNPFAYIPFSAGPRNCIGQKFAMYEMKMVLYKVLSKFELVSAGSKYTPEIMVELIMKSSNGIHVLLKKRQF